MQLNDQDKKLDLRMRRRRRWGEREILCIGIPSCICILEFASKYLSLKLAHGFFIGFIVSVGFFIIDTHVFC